MERERERERDRESERQSERQSEREREGRGSTLPSFPSSAFFFPFDRATSAADAAISAVESA